MPGAVPTGRKAPSPSGKRRKYISDDYKNDQPERSSGFPDRVPHRGFLENKSNENFSPGQPFRPNPKAKRGSKRDKHRRNAEPFLPEKCAPGKDISARHCTQENRPQPDRAAEPRRTFETASADTPSFRPRRSPSKRVPNALPTAGLTAERSRTAPSALSGESGRIFRRNSIDRKTRRTRHPLRRSFRATAVSSQAAGTGRRPDTVQPPSQRDAAAGPGSWTPSHLRNRLRRHAAIPTSSFAFEAGSGSSARSERPDRTDVPQHASGENFPWYREVAGSGGFRLFFRRISLHLSRRIG